MSIKHALVVDDSKSARFSLKKLLQQQDIKTDFAESAGDALNYLSSNNPDIIFMDHLMPGMDGFEATKAIKANPDTKDIPIIMCTSKEGNDYAQQALAIGADAILPKPAPAATLAAILNRLDPSTAAKADAGKTETKPAAPQSVGISTRVVENIVRKVLEDKFESFQKALSDSIKENLGKEIKEDLDRSLNELRNEVNNRIEAKIKEKGTEIAKSVAGELIDTRHAELSHHVDTQISNNLSAIDSALDATRRPSPELIEEVKKVAQFTAAATAGEAAKEAATDISRSVAQDVAQEEMSDLKATVSEQLNQELGGKMGVIQMVSVVALICGGAALALNFL